MLVDVRARLLDLLVRRLKAYVLEGNEVYREELTTGNFKGIYEQGLGYINICVKSLKSDLIVYDLQVSGAVDTIFIESAPYYRGNIYNSYFSTVFDGRDVEDSDLKGLVKEILNSIRTDEQVEFIYSLVVGGEVSTKLHDYTHKVLNYLNTNKKTGIEKLELRVVKTDEMTGFVSEFDYDTFYFGDDDVHSQVINLRFYKNEWRELLGILRIAQKFKHEFDGTGKYVGAKVIANRVISQNCNLGTNVNIGLSDPEGVEEINECVDNIRDIPGLEEGFINLIDSLGILK